MLGQGPRVLTMLSKPSDFITTRRAQETEISGWDCEEWPVSKMSVARALGSAESFQGLDGRAGHLFTPWAGCD